MRYLAAMDESASDGRFSSGGFVAPQSIWDEYLRPAWTERVLAGRPELPYLHMVDARDHEWRNTHGISRFEMGRRLDEAARVIQSTGPLALIGATLSEAQLEAEMGDAKLVMPTKQPGVYQMEADYLGFLNFVYVTLIWIDKFAPEAECVDFVVERKQDVSRCFHDFFKDIGPNLEAIGLAGGAKLVGHLTEGGKDDAALQAVDFALWHKQRHFSGRARPEEGARWRAIIDSRLGYWHEIEDGSIADLGRSARDNTVPDPRKRRSR